MPRVVHVVLGSSAPVPGGTGKTVTVRDFLSCGPLVPIESVAVWTAARREYWDADEDDLVGDPNVLRDADRVILWLGTETADQIALAWLPAYLQALDAKVAEIEVIQFERNERDVEILSVAMLSPKELSAHPSPVILTGDHLAELDLVWRALTAPEPSALVAYARSASVRFAFLPRALRAFLTRYPDAATGVNAWEEQLLRSVQKSGPRAAHVIGDALIAGYDALRAGTGGVDHVGDGWLSNRMLRLADPRMKEPALAIMGSRTAYRLSEVRLTPFGERILDGEANFVDANGIDDWVGGVHLQSDEGRVWFHRDGELVRR